MLAVNKNPTVQDLHKFGWAMLAGFGTLGLIAWVLPWVRGTEADLLDWSGSRAQITAVCFWGAGLVLCAASFLHPAVGRPVYVVWMTVAMAVGAVMTTVLLTLLYFLLIPWFSLVVRVGDPLRKKLSDESTYWEDYPEYEPTLERMRRQF